MGVVTVTLNPAIDQTISLDRLVPGEVHRPLGVRQDAGGKGINVASCLADWGLPVTVLGMMGANNAAVFEALFDEKRIVDRMVRVPGATRVNLKIVDGTGTTDINLDGPPVTPANVATVFATAASLATPDTLLILSGSMPPGCPPESYAAIIPALREKGARVFLDTSGAPLTHVLAGDVLPDCIKPNRQELADWSGEPLAEIADVVRVAARLHARGIALVVVSMGAEGALFLSDEGALVAALPADHVASTVGAGDAMVAGITAATVEGASLERIARLATAFAVAKLGCVGPHLPARAAVEALARQVIITATERSGTAMAGVGA